jgi:hypothetical protein
MEENIKENDINLPVYSYSKLDLFDQCNYKYKLKYIDKNFSDESTLALEIGTIAHKGEELKARYLMENKEIDFEFIKNAVMNGIEEKTDKDSSFLKGINELKKTYFMDYYTKCNKTGMIYDEKLDIYFSAIKNKDFTKDGWKVLAVEKSFNFVYNNRCILKGFIDRIDINEDGDLRVVDYKTSKSIYDSKKLATPLQMVVYALACQSMYNKLPIEFVYDFIFLNEEQTACTKGYLARGEKKLNKILNNIDNCFETEEYIPSATPLCYWCDFASHTPLANKKMKDFCNYHLMWTPNDKNYRKKSEYNKRINTDSISKEKDVINENPFNPFSSTASNPFIANPFASNNQKTTTINPFASK